MTRGRFGAAMVAVALLIGGVVWFWWSRSATAAGCSASAPRDVGAPVANSLVVAEQGLSKVGPWTFTVGAIVANRATGPAAYRATVTFRLVDAAGREVAALAPRSVPVVLPGAGLPVGAVMDVRPEQGGAVARVDAVVGSGRWVKVERYNPLFHRYDVLAESDGPSPPDFLMPANLATVPCRGLSATGGAIVYRDAGGAIVGGEAVAYNGEYCAGTHAGDRVAGRHVPDGIEARRTQIAVYCDVG
ncbi:hypothetical protein ACQP1P_45815 [Dactylosporangium sp. CA-052675]|uniref:hypothetical protein n=1 Tax=Dactylosporangium sp. CA-052675 TaxID=3239927 RepID=UPI003D91B04C